MTDGVTTSKSVVSEIVSTLRGSSSIVICITPHSSLDVVASALALAEALRHEGKSATVVSSLGVDPSVTLHGVEAISRQFTAEGDTLKVIVPFTGAGIENVSYNIEDSKLNILITPEKGYDRIKTEDVIFTYAGGKPDLICVLNAPTLSSLGDTYESNKDQFTGTPIINIDTHFANSSYGTLNFIDKDASSMVQHVNEILRELKTPMNESTAQNLYEALVSATQNFSSASVNAKTFRMAAFLIDHMPAEQKDSSPVVESEPSPVPAPIEAPIVSPAEAVVEVPAPGFQPASPVGMMQQPKDVQLKPNIFQAPSAGMNKG